jgi:hypothetical protein
MKQDGNGCPECSRIAREISETLVELLRSGDAGDAWKQAKRRQAEVLKNKQFHELRTGHRVHA